MRQRRILGEGIHPIVFANWQGRPLYILLVYLLGQVVIDPPIFVGAVYFISYITGVSSAEFALPGGIVLAMLVILVYLLYLRYSGNMRRFLAEQIDGEFPQESLATAAWCEAVTFPQRVVSWVIAACSILSVLLIALLIPRYGFYTSLMGGMVTIAATVALSQVVFLFFLESAMNPIGRLALSAGARPSLENLGRARLRLRSKLLFLIFLIVVLPVSVMGLFGYSRIIALGGDPTDSLRLTGLVAALANALAILLALFLIRSLSTPVREIRRVMEEVGRGNLAVSVNPLTTDELAELGLYFNRMVDELREQEQLKIAFSQYVSEAVRDGILSGTIALGGERREITILFTDIRGFTAWCEQESPENVIQTLNAYYESLIQALTKYGGTVTRYTGDGVLALFGAPLDDPDHALHAVQAAWEAHTLLDKFNDIRRKLSAFELHTGFGIHTGPAVVGSIGCEARAEYTPIGDAANVASRIEGLNREMGTAILISAATYRRVANLVTVGKKTETSVKGRSQSVRVLEVVGVRPPSPAGD